MGRTTPRVSVVVPTFNRAHTLGRSLSSVRGQTRPAQEILVVDDGSTDGTGPWLERDYPEVRVLRQDTRGVSAARNLGIRAATGDWIAFLDSDDEWLPQKLERQLASIAEQPQYLLCHTDEIWIRRGRRVNPMKKHGKKGGFIFEHCLPLCAISPSSVLLHRSLLDDVGTFDESLPACEDYDLWLRVTARYPVLYLDERLIRKYGGHADQLSRRFWGMDRFRIVALEKILECDTLDAGQRMAAQAMLRQKIVIYAQGARKRGKIEEAARYERKLEFAGARP